MLSAHIPMLTGAVVVVFQIRSRPFVRERQELQQNAARLTGPGTIRSRNLRDDIRYTVNQSEHMPGLKSANTHRKNDTTNKATNKVSE